MTEGAPNLKFLLFKCVSPDKVTAFVLAKCIVTNVCIQNGFVSFWLLSEYEVG